MERRDFLKRSALVGAAAAVTGPLTWVPEASAGSRIRWGICTVSRGSMSQPELVRHLEREVGRRFGTTHHRLAWDVPLVNSYSSWAANGRTPLISWFSRLSGGGSVSWSSIAGGSHDAWIRQQARNLKSSGWSGYISFNKEPEDEGSPQDWKNAYGRVRGIFDETGVDRFRWIVALMASTFLAGDADRWMPTRYDIVGVDGFNRGGCHDPWRWRSFAEIMRPARRYAKNRGKKLYVVETGCIEGEPGAKARWLDGSRRTAKRWPELIGLSYNHEATDCTYWVDSSGSSMRAFRRMGADPAFDG